MGCHGGKRKKTAKTEGSVGKRQRCKIEALFLMYITVRFECRVLTL